MSTAKILLFSGYEPELVHSVLHSNVKELATDDGVLWPLVQDGWDKGEMNLVNDNAYRMNGLNINIFSVMILEHLMRQKDIRLSLIPIDNTIFVKIGNSIYAHDNFNEAMKFAGNFFYATTKEAK